ncbi:MAG: UTP--glucose-1-phosphate uridylyltransferase [Bacilli bacterium]
MKKIRKAIIPAAGLGTRFLPATKTIPKELFPIMEKPTLQYIIEECVASGIEDVYLVVSPNKKIIENYFSPNKDLEKKYNEEQLKIIMEITKLCKIHYVIQKEQLGSGHAINLVKDYIGDEPFAILYGDDLMMYEKPVLKQLIDVYEKYNCNVIGVKTVLDKEVNRYGIIEYDDIASGKIKSLVEKPSFENAPSNKAGLGRYIVKPEIFKELDEINLASNKEYLFTDALKNLMQKQSFYSCEFIGKYFDIGNKLGFIKANVEFGLKRDEIAYDLKKYLNDLIKSL